MSQRFTPDRPASARPARRARPWLAFALLVPLLADAGPNYSAYSDSVAYVQDLPSNLIVSPWSLSQVSGFNDGVGQWSASSTNFGGTFDGRTVSSSGSASLLDGTLHAQSYTSSSASEHGYSTEAHATAILGDRFLAGDSNSSAFSWTPGAQGHFSIQLDGTTVNNTVGGSAFAILSFLITSVNGGKTAFGIFSATRFDAGDEVPSVYIDPDNAMPFSLGWSLDPTSGAYTVTADFNPGGDFDWQISLGTDAELSNDFETASSDFSHTAHIGYTGPDGSTTYSASGVFPGTLAGMPSPVPEPASWVLALCGFAGLFAHRRRRLVQGRYVNA